MVMRALLLCLGIMERIKRGEDSRGLDSDCTTAPTCDGRPDFVRTPFWVIKYFMESLSNSFQWIQTHIHICSESATIDDLLQSPFLPMVLRHLILAQWALYRVGAR